jgi:hypothetical protein
MYVKDITKDITGQGITTSVGMEAADLGIARWDDARQANAVMFGDNFTNTGLAGEWQSPSIVMYDKDFNVLGVPGISSGLLPACRRPNIKQGNRSQLWPYNHDVDGPPGTFSTVLPTDFIKMGGWWYVHVMVCRDLGNGLWTEWQRSKDLVTWEWVSKLQPPDPKRTMLTFELFDGLVMICGTGGLARNAPIWQWYTLPETLTDPATWVPLNNGDPVLDGKFGELCLRNIGGYAALSYFDAAGYKMSARIQSNPTALWDSTPELTYTTGQLTPQCYGGYITPDSTPDSMGFLVSQWNTATNDPYKVMLIKEKAI